MLALSLANQRSVCRHALAGDAKGGTAHSGALLMIFATLAGLKHLSRLSSYQDIGLAVLAGLPKLPTPASVHQFLDHNREKTQIMKKIGAIMVLLGVLLMLYPLFTYFYATLR